jgi:hypothetical protein
MTRKHYFLDENNTKKYSFPNNFTKFLIKKEKSSFFPLFSLDLSFLWTFFSPNVENDDEEGEDSSSTSGPDEAETQEEVAKNDVKMLKEDENHVGRLEDLERGDALADLERVERDLQRPKRIRKTNLVARTSSFFPSEERKHEMLYERRKKSFLGGNFDGEFVFYTGNN